jgi:hypothetical protein
MNGGAVDHLFETMEQCRIRWGRVESVDGAEVQVAVQPLLRIEGQLRLGEPVDERVQRWVDGRGFVDGVRPGEVVSIHWGWACDRLSHRQASNLERYTRWHLQLANQTL